METGAGDPETTGQREVFPLPADDSITPEGFPEELRALPQWVDYRLVPKAGEGFDKWPINPGYTGKKASTTDPTTWSTFEHALRVARMHPFLDGVGFVFTASDPYCGIDFDGCIHGGEVDPWVASWLKKLGGYQEVSQSGAGVHAIVKAELPGKGRKRVLEGRKVEVYDRGRFFAVTGRKIGGSPEEAQMPVEDLYLRMEPPPEVAQQIRRLRSPVLDHDELLEKARTAANGYKFRHLYDEGSWRKLGYPSQSEADHALVNLLIFWTGGDREQVLELFERSALYRREKRGGYVERTVDGALAGYRGSFYDPEHKSEGMREALEPYFRLVDAAAAWKGGKRPSARKTLAGMLLVACEHASKSAKGATFGLDLRTLSEVSHVSLPTLSRSSLPLLSREKIVRWAGKGRGQRSSRFLMALPPVWDLNIRSSHAYNVKDSHTLGEEERRELLRASMGRSPYSQIARVGNSKQVLLEHLVGTPGGRRSVSYLSHTTGRRVPDVRRNMRELNGLNLAVEVSEDLYGLPPDFWARWERVLEASGVIRSEERKKKHHEYDRLLQAKFFPTLTRDGGPGWADPETGEVLDHDAAAARVGGQGRCRAPTATPPT